LGRVLFCVAAHIGILTSSKLGVRKSDAVSLQ
jgi:hypothetical protein